MTDREPTAAPTPVCVVVDVANVVGSRPDGWWRDRAGAAARLLAGLSELSGRTTSLPDGKPVLLEQIVAVVEGAAKAVDAPHGVRAVRAPGDGDSTIVATAQEHSDAGAMVLVVTADRGLRARLADGVLVTGPSWLNALLGR